MADTTDLLGFAIEKNPVDFADTLNQMLQQKAHDAIEAHRVTIAQAIHGGEDTPDDDIGDDEFDFSDDELEDLGDDEDLDLDLEDLDLDDLDLDYENEDEVNDEDA
jgi:ribonuclease E